VPGLALALLASRLKDPREGLPLRDPRPLIQTYRTLYSNRSYRASTLAMAAMTFALGGLAVWMPTFLTRAWGLDVARAGLVFGGLTVVSGLVGSLAGGWLGDRLLAYTGKAYFLVSGAGLLLALPFGIWALRADSYPLALVLLLITETLAFLNMGPLNAAIVWVTAAPVRSTAFAANIFAIHALGDALSPFLIGKASDLWGLGPALSAAMCFLALAGGICLWGARHIEEDSRRIEHAL
jgi:hypothetical protein